MIAVLIKREIRRGNVKSKRDGHFWSCKFFQKVKPFSIFVSIDIFHYYLQYTQSKAPKDGKIPAKIKPQWLLVGHHELPDRYYTKDGTNILSFFLSIKLIFFRMSTIYLSNVYY